MSYSHKVKEILSQKKDRKKCCKAAFLYGMSVNKIVSQSVGATFAAAPVEDTRKLTEGREKEGRDKPCPYCKKAFFRGLFLSSGSISDPKDAYHLEFSLNDEKIAFEIKDLLDRENILLKYVKRRNKHVLYLKASERIEDFLYYINAEKISFDIMETKIFKDFRNNANRVTNFENANLEKISKASAEQIDAIKVIMKKGRLDSLPDELKQTAKLRLKNIELSTQEIGEISNPPVSKSGINHRMRRIIDIAKELEEEK